MEVKKRMKRTWFMLPLLLAVCLVLFNSPTFAKAKAGSDIKNRTSRTTLNGVLQDENVTNQTLVNVGQVAMWIYSNGQSAISPDGNSGLLFPRGTNPTVAAIFTDGLVWGGQVNDGAEPLLRVGGGTYSIGTVPGRIVSPGVNENLSDRVNVDRVWRVRRDFATADLAQDAAEFNQIQAKDVSSTDIDLLRSIYRRDWVDWPAQKGAPFYDADGDGQYNPQFNADGTPKLFPEADEPGVADADQVVWIVNNDLDPGAVQTLYGSPSIGMEQQITLWAYKRADALGQIVFKQFRYIYKGTAITPIGATIDSMIISQWSDPDVGQFTDDFAGSDTSLSLGYAYNSSSVDATYSSVGLPPPASGYDFFAGPLVPSEGSTAIFGLKQRSGFKNLPMTTFGFFAAGGEDTDPTRGGDYNGTRQWWNLLRGFRPRPESPHDPWINPVTNTVTKFVLTGDPVAGTGWIDSSPGDRRILLASGPFTMAVGDTNEAVVAVMAALGSDRLSSVSVLKFVDRFAQEAFDNLFELPKAPPAPPLTATEFNGEVLLNWGGIQASVEATESSNEKGFLFEGYNVYQLPSAGASISQGIRLATFDLVDEATVIAQESFDQNSGLVLELPVQFGKNSGLQHSMTVDRDQIRDTNLINGQTYFFGVTAYNFNSDKTATLKTLESTPTVVTVVPQMAKPGDRLSSALGDTLGNAKSDVNVLHTGPSDGNVIVLATDPSKITGDDYLVAFSVDTTTGQDLWDLIDTSNGDTVLARQTNQTGDDAYLNADGLTVKVFGAPSDFARMANGGPAFIEVANENGPLAEADYDGNGAPFGGNNVWHSLNAGGFGDRYFLSTTTSGESGMRPNFDELVPFDWELRFTTLADGAWGWWAFTTGNVAKVPFQIWNVGSATPDDPSDDFELIPIMFEGGGTPDAYTPDHGPDGAFGFPAFDRIYWYLPAAGESYADHAADAEDDGALAADHTSTEVLGRLLVADFDGNGEPPLPGSIDRIITTKPNTPTDTFTFSTGSFKPTASVALEKKDLKDLVNVFPNPYLGFNAFEQNRFQRFVTFSHLPQKAVVRIFNLAGVMVKKLQKDDASQFMTWNVQNEGGLPVASGIYIAHIEFPGLSLSKDLKMVIVQEQQFLRNF